MALAGFAVVNIDAEVEPPTFVVFADDGAVLYYLKGKILQAPVRQSGKVYIVALADL